MDPTLIAISMHGLERLAAVALGGLAVYYGFKLFLTLPTQTNSDGQIRLPGVSVVLAKAGPGVFFAAFGALVIVSSLVWGVEIDDGKLKYRGFGGKPNSAKEQPSNSPRQAPAAKPSAAEHDVARVELAVLSMNCMTRLASARAKGLGGDFDQSARESKLALLSSVWQPDKWGGYAEFEQWATGRAKGTASAVKALFESERGDCPR